MSATTFSSTFRVFTFLGFERGVLAFIISQRLDLIWSNDNDGINCTVWILDNEWMGCLLIDLNQHGRRRLIGKAPLFLRFCFCFILRNSIPRFFCLSARFLGWVTTAMEWIFKRKGIPSFWIFDSLFECFGHDDTHDTMMDLFT